MENRLFKIKIIIFFKVPFRTFRLSLNNMIRLTKMQYIQKSLNVYEYKTIQNGAQTVF